jgi:hypothetical protein
MRRTVLGRLVLVTAVAAAATMLTCFALVVVLTLQVVAG